MANNHNGPSTLGIRKLRDFALVVSLFAGLSVVIGVGVIYGTVRTNIEGIVENGERLHREIHDLRDEFRHHVAIPIHPMAAERVSRNEQAITDLQRRLNRLDR